ncbi:WD40 repeat-like protein [Mycena chlorophos]|uniref:WD40 repeat-like protein n=1 Tax=Mycena chlorophos TaxID=658473 RepID=A0A8H6THY7_MYCCL|nr:WD40 repeat-like protein [Mycena chlorophos]
MSGLAFAAFNQDYSCVSLGTRGGYSIINCDPFGRVYTQNDGPRGIVEMLFCTSLIALVGVPDTPTSSPRKLQIVNTKRQSMICELLFPSTILTVRLNRKTLVVVLETEIYLYDISNMRLLHVIETLPNPEGICALSPSADAPYLAYPAPLPSPALSAASESASAAAAGTSTAGGGDVMLFSTRALAPVNAVRAHRSPLAMTSLSGDGSLLATVSVKGTVIRVFATPTMDKLYQFRRGARETHIYSLAFNPAGTLLAAGSERGTVHLWKIGGGNGKNAGSGSSRASVRDDSSVTGSAEGDVQPQPDYDVNGSQEGKKGMSTVLRRRSLNLTSSLTRAAASYLPSSIAEMWEPTRDFAFFRLPPPVPVQGGGSGSLDRRCVVGLSATTPHAMVISSDGYFYVYSIDLEKGGECVLVKQYSLLESSADGGIGRRAITSVLAEYAAVVPFGFILDIP